MNTHAAFYQLEQYAQHKAVIDNNLQILSYAELAILSDEMAAQIGPERKLVVILASNNKDSLCAYLACLRAGHVALLLDSNLDQELQAVIFELYQPNLIIRTDKDEATVFEFYSKIKHQLHPDLALLLSTSGSTGSPKLVRLSFNNLQANAQSIASYLPIDTSSKAITSLPFFYSYGLSVINSHLLRGASIALNNDGVMSQSFWTLFKQARVNSFSGVPYSISLLESMRFNIQKFPDLRYITVAGGRLKKSNIDYLKRIAKQKKLSIYRMYGQTEATARIAYLPAADFEQKDNCIGHVIADGELSLIDQQGQVINEDKAEGELVYKGPNVMMGYAQSIAMLALGHETTALKTGDVAYKEDNYFYITGRLKRFIKILGLRINLDDVEKALSLLACDILCVGVDDLLIVAYQLVEIEQTDHQQTSTVETVITQKLQRNFGINAAYITLKAYTVLPHLATGKADYPAILEACHVD